MNVRMKGIWLCLPPVLDIWLVHTDCTAPLACRTHPRCGGTSLNPAGTHSYIFTRAPSLVLAVAHSERTQRAANNFQRDTLLIGPRRRREAPRRCRGCCFPPLMLAGHLPFKPPLRQKAQNMQQKQTSTIIPAISGSRIPGSSQISGFAPGRCAGCANSVAWKNSSTRSLMSLPSISVAPPCGALRIDQ